MWQNTLINTRLLICLFSPSLSPQHLYGRHCSFMVRAAVYCKKPKQDQKLKDAKEFCIKEAIAWLHADPTRKITAAQRQFLVNYDTLCHCYLSHHQPAHQSQEHQQILSQSEEQVLVDWIEHRSTTRWPLSKHSLKFKLEGIIGYRPGKRWTNKFLS